MIVDLNGTHRYNKPSRGPIKGSSISLGAILLQSRCIIPSGSSSVSFFSSTQLLGNKPSDRAVARPDVFVYSLTLRRFLPSGPRQHLPRDAPRTNTHSGPPASHGSYLGFPFPRSTSLGLARAMHIVLMAEKARMEDDYSGVGQVLMCQGEGTHHSSRWDGFEVDNAQQV